MDVIYSVMVSLIQTRRFYVHYLGYLLKVMLSIAEFPTMAVSYSLSSMLIPQQLSTVLYRSSWE